MRLNKSTEINDLDILAEVKVIPLANQKILTEIKR